MEFEISNLLNIKRRKFMWEKYYGYDR